MASAKLQSPRISESMNMWLRLALVGFVSCVVQLAGVSQIRVFGVNADLSPLVVASAGVLTGAVPGATFGFAVGVFLDFAFVRTLGVSALIYTCVGYGAGRLRELRAPEAPFTPLALGAAATVVATVGYGALEFMLGDVAPISLVLLRDIVLTVIYNTLLALPVYAIVRRWLVPALPDDPRRRRRRRAYTTGGLSPLSRS